MQNIRYYSQILWKVEFLSAYFRKKKSLKIKFNEIRPVTAELIHADGQTEKLVINFAVFAKAHKDWFPRVLLSENFCTRL